MNLVLKFLSLLFLLSSVLTVLDFSLRDSSSIGIEQSIQEEVEESENEVYQENQYFSEQASLETEINSLDLQPYINPNLSIWIIPPDLDCSYSL